MLAVWMCVCLDVYHAGGTNSSWCTQRLVIFPAHMGVDPWVDFLKCRGRSVFCLPYFLGGRHFCTNALGIH